MIVSVIYFLDERRVQADGAWIRARRGDAREDKHVANEEGRLHVVVRIASTCAVCRKGVGVPSSERIGRRISTNPDGHFRQRTF